MVKNDALKRKSNNTCTKSDKTFKHETFTYRDTKFYKLKHTTLFNPNHKLTRLFNKKPIQVQKNQSNLSLMKFSLTINPNYDFIC